jgi:hypothetical protein
MTLNLLLPNNPPSTSSITPVGMSYLKRRRASALKVNCSDSSLKLINEAFHLLLSFFFKLFAKNKIFIILRSWDFFRIRPFDGNLRSIFSLFE